MRQQLLGALLVLVTTGCAASTRRAAGSATAAIGAVVATGAVTAMDPCLFHQRKPGPYASRRCDPTRPDAKGIDGAIGVPILLGGVVTMLIGGVLFVSGSQPQGPIKQLPLEPTLYPAQGDQALPTGR